MERQFGPYRLIRQIAVGGMAEIHLAKTAGIAGFEKYVALKMIHPNFAEDDQFIQMLVDEAKIAVQLTHGNIAQTFDLGRVGDTYYITMEYVDGADLYKLLRRASEQDREMPLDVCAFVGKEISSALDHAHRKRDHAGKSLGIVHRDVSPQNVLVSYSGEVKLVDFGIAKATMKVRQTAVGVIKGKYYYMSPEQAWGDPIDHRSDIFSAGIVLYEMITGQMLYLEEDLHKLLEMARSAQIQPPSVLRRGVPPQLERIVMHALAKVPGERYQSAGDLATDLERFLHTYSPVFTAGKLTALLRDVIGDPMQVPDDDGFENIEFRDGVMSTHPLADSEVAHAIDRDELRDENSVIFRMSELERKNAAALAATPPAPPPPPAPPAPRPLQPGKLRPPAARSEAALADTAPSNNRAPSPVPRVTRATDPLPPERPSPVPAKLPPLRPIVPAKIPHIAKPPRQAHEETRELERAPAAPGQDDSGLLTLTGLNPVAPAPPPAAAKPIVWDDASGDDDLDNIGERTLITTMPGMSGFMIDSPTEDGVDRDGFDGDGPVEATLITMAPTGPDGRDLREDSAINSGFSDDEPTADRQPDEPAAPARRPAPPRAREAPAALAAKIQQPAISELRKPRASRRTPPGGSPISAPNVLQAIVASRGSEPIPTTRSQPLRNAPALAPSPAPPPPPPPFVPPPMPLAPAAPASAVTQMVQSGPTVSPQPALTDPFASQFSIGAPGNQPSYTADASGMPLGIPTPPGTQSYPPPMTVQPDGQMAYLGVPVAYAPPPPTQPQHGYPVFNPSQFYPFPQPPQPVSISGQMRAYEVDEIPSQYKLGAARRRWLTYIVSGVLAVSIAASVTFLIIRWMHKPEPLPATVRIESVPAGADVYFDGTKMLDKTPMTIPHAPLGTRHTVRVKLSHYDSHEEAIDIPANGGEIAVMASLKAISAKILVESQPSGAEIRIDGALRGHTPTTIGDVDRDSVKTIELRLKDYQPYVKSLQDAAWTQDSKLSINARLTR